MVQTIFFPVRFFPPCAILTGGICRLPRVPSPPQSFFERASWQPPPPVPAAAADNTLTASDAVVYENNSSCATACFRARFSRGPDRNVLRESRVYHNYFSFRRVSNVYLSVYRVSRRDDICPALTWKTIKFRFYEHSRAKAILSTAIVW